MLRFLLLLALMMLGIGPADEALASATAQFSTAQTTAMLLAKKKKKKRRKKRKKKKKKKKKKKRKKKKKKKAKAKKKKKKKEAEAAATAEPAPEKVVPEVTNEESVPKKEAATEAKEVTTEAEKPAAKTPIGPVAPPEADSTASSETVPTVAPTIAKGPLGVFSKRGEMIMLGGLGVAVVGFGTGVFGLTQTLSGDETRRGLLGKAVWEDAERTEFQDATAQSALGRTLNTTGYGLGVAGFTVALIGIFL